MLFYPIKVINNMFSCLSKNIFFFVENYEHITSRKSGRKHEALAITITVRPLTVARLIEFMRLRRMMRLNLFSIMVNRLDLIVSFRVKFSISMSMNCLLFVAVLDIAQRSERVLLNRFQLMR